MNDSDGDAIKWKVTLPPEIINFVFLEKLEKQFKLHVDYA
jgi:hypothetical protein